MKHIKFVLAAVLLLGGFWMGGAGHGGTAAQLGACWGKGTPPPGASGTGPWATRLLMATSPDGLNWTRTGFILTDQGGVPDAIIDDQGKTRVYYVSWCHGNKIVVALSEDHEHWRFERVNFLGYQAQGLFTPPDFVDPDIVRLEDGRFRLYFAWGGAGAVKIYSAISPDGINFTIEEGARFEIPGANVNDPTVLKTGDLWRMYTHQGNYAFSRDGLNFTRSSDLGLEDMVFANGIPLSGGYRFYGFGRGGIRSAFSVDGEQWTIEPGFRLQLDPSNKQESGLLAEPAVVPISDGSYLMFYQTVIP